MKYGAITLDTSIFDKHGLKLEHGLLKTLEQFKGKPAGLVLSEIVVREVLAHFTEKVVDASSQLNRALQECAEYIGDRAAYDSARSTLVPKLPSKDTANARLKAFIDRTGAAVVTVEAHAKMKDLITRYFNHVAPFSEQGKKKNEFPDAMALLSLEGYARENRIKILAVSTDGDWAAFAAGSEWIDVTTDLAAGIADFQPQATAFELCNRLAKALAANEAPNVLGALKSQIAEAASELDIDPDADCQFDWESNYLEINFKDLSFVENEDGVAALNPVQLHDHKLTVEAKVILSVTASGEFSLSVYDSVDKDSVAMGSASKSIDVDFDTEILFTLSGDFEDECELDALEVADVEILSSPAKIQFGMLRPDGWDEDPR